MCTGKIIQNTVLEQGFGYCCGKILEAVSLVHRSMKQNSEACLTKGGNMRGGRLDASVPSRLFFIPFLWWCGSCWHCPLGESECKGSKPEGNQNNTEVDSSTEMIYFFVVPPS